MDKSIVMYTRTAGCPFVSLAKKVFDDYNLAYHEVFIDKDMLAKQRVLAWTGFLSVPTIVAAAAGNELPYADPVPLAKGTSPRGIDRETMITEPNVEQLTAWLKKHEFITIAEEQGGD